MSVKSLTIGLLAISLALGSGITVFAMSRDNGGSTSCGYTNAVSGGMGGNVVGDHMGSSNMTSDHMTGDHMNSNAMAGNMTKHMGNYMASNNTNCGSWYGNAQTSGTN